MDKYTLYLDSPASEWELASPVGSGDMGAMSVADFLAFAKDQIDTKNLEN